jgi:hypothetical protein
LVMVLISCAPVVGVLNFFSAGTPAMFLREGVYWICYPFQGSCCGAEYLFSPFSEGTGVPTL